MKDIPKTPNEVKVWAASVFTMISLQFLFVYFFKSIELFQLVTGALVVCVVGWWGSMIRDLKQCVKEKEDS
jgi:hypothetical protein